MSGSLRNKRILVTREQSQAKQFSHLIKQSQGEPIEVPLLNIRCQNDSFLNDSKQFEWIFFTSAHGVHCFFKKYEKALDFNNCLFASVGHKTENALKEYGYKATFIPSTYNAEVMAEEFFTEYPEADHILLVRGNLSRQLLVDELTERGLSFETLVVYETAPFVEMKETLLKTLKTEKLDFLTFTSPSTVRVFMDMVKEQSDQDRLLHIPCVCIGTTTENCAKQYHFSNTVVPEVFTIESMVEKMVEYIQMEGTS